MGRRKGPGRAGLPGRDVPLQPRSLLSLGLAGGVAGRGAAAATSPRQMGRGVKTVIAAPDRVAAAARLLPAASLTGTASPGSAGVTDPRGERGTTETRAGGRSRVPPAPCGAAAPGCRLLWGVGVCRLFCACQRRVSSFRAIYI